MLDVSEDHHHYGKVSQWFIASAVKMSLSGLCFTHSAVAETLTIFQLSVAVMVQ